MTIRSAVFIQFCLFVSLQTLGITTATANPPNTQQGIPGTLINGPFDPDMGRLANIQFLGGYVITIPETPGSEQGDHLLTRAWDMRNLFQPTRVTPNNPNTNGGDFGQTGDPFLAHGTIARGNEVFIGGNQANSNDGGPSYDTFDTIRLEDNGTLTHTRWSGPTAPALVDRQGNPVFNNQGGREFAAWYTKGSLMRPWSVSDNWSYNTSPNIARLTLRNVLMAEWDVVAETGVAGFGNFMGNLLIYASDQRANGVAVYDATDIVVDAATGESRPRLLDVINVSANQGGLGGYWSEISGHYLVIGRQEDSANPNSFSGVQVVDFSNPNDLKLQCQAELSNPEGHKGYFLGASPRYVGLQDNFAFMDNFKVNIENCEVEARMDTSNGQRTSGFSECLPAYVDDCPKLVAQTGEYARPIGNLLFTGGFPIQANVDGLSIWAHQSAPDTRPPAIAYHIPQANRTNYPVNAPLSFSIPETLKIETLITSETRRPGQVDSITVTEVGGSAIPIDYVLSHQGMLTLDPINLLKQNTTYEVSFTSAIQDAVGNAMVPYTFRFSTGDQVQGGGSSEPAVIQSVLLNPGNTVETDQPVTVTVVSSNATEYQITLDGEASAYSASASRSFTFSEPGQYFVNTQARNSDGESATQRVAITVVNPNQARAPGRNSSALACDAERDRVWVTNPDNGSVAVVAGNSLSKLDELYGPIDPKSAAVVGDEVWVTSKGSDQIYIYDAQTRQRLSQISTGFGTAPTHLLASADGNYVYVTLYGSGEVARYSVFNPSSNPDIIKLAPTVQAMALSPNGDQLLVTRLISPEHWGEVFQIDTSSWSLLHRYELEKHTVNDSLSEGRGKPNYLTSVIVNGKGNRAYVVGKKDNIDRGLLAGLNEDLDDDNAVRTIGMVLDIQNRVELKDQRIDFDNTSSLSALAMSADSQYLFVAQQGKNSVLALQVGSDDRFTGVTHSYQTGLAPQGLCLDSFDNTLYVKNFTDRTLTQFDLSGGFASPARRDVQTVANEVLSNSELAGLQLFYNAFAGLTSSQPIGKMSAEGYISCASCHLDGGEDGNSYDFTGRGEGLRNNISLKGRKGLRFGRVHWSANFDEIQDFEHDIRDHFRGLGFMSQSDFDSSNSPLGNPKRGLSQDLDNLAAYVSSLGKQSLPRSLQRTSFGQFSNAALQGQQVFRQQGCQQCHSGSAFTDARTHDVGTLRAASGQRLGDTLSAIKTPSLLGVFETPPYLHDGSAKTLDQVFNTAGGTTYQLDDPNTVWNYNGEYVTQSGYSYLRDARGIRLVGDEANTGSWNFYALGSPGAGKVRVRYGSSTTGGSLDVLVDGNVAGTISLDRLPQVDNQDALFTESRSVDVVLPDGGYNIAFRYRGNSSVILDEFTVSNASDLAKAQPHLRVANLSLAQQNNLVRYVASIDQVSAPADSAVNIFDNETSTNPPAGPAQDMLCFPIPTKAGGMAMICL